MLPPLFCVWHFKWYCFFFFSGFVRRDLSAPLSHFWLPFQFSNLQEGNEMLSDLLLIRSAQLKMTNGKGLNQAGLGRRRSKKLEKKIKTFRRSLNYSNNSIKLIPAVSILHNWVHLLIAATRREKKRRREDGTLYLCVIKPLSQMYTQQTISSVGFLLSRWFQFV